MSPFQKRLARGLLVMALLSPLGILLPLWFRAGGAWGEWGADTLKELLGYVPEGLRNYAGLWKAPLPGYSFGESGSLFAYIASGVLGSLLAGLAVLLIAKFLRRHGK